jgi:hypothetical protein
MDIAPIGPLDPGAAADAAPRRAPRAPARGEDTAAVSAAAIPSAPPAEVLDAIGAAAGRHDELLAQGRELRFEPAPDGGVRIELLDGDGNILRTVAPSEALDIATGRDVE